MDERIVIIRRQSIERFTEEACNDLDHVLQLTLRYFVPEAIQQAPALFPCGIVSLAKIRVVSNWGWSRQPFETVQGKMFLAEALRMPGEEKRHPSLCHAALDQVAVQLIAALTKQTPIQALAPGKGRVKGKRRKAGNLGAVLVGSAKQFGDVKDVVRPDKLHCAALSLT